jgi:FkbM family methyltransferase
MVKGFQYVKEKLKPLFKVRSKDKIEEYLSKYLGPPKSIIIVDIGAHRGDFIDSIERHYEIGKAVLIEPIPDLAIYLQSKFNRGNILIFQNVLCDKDQESVEFQINEYEETSSLLQIKSDMVELSNVETRLAKKVNVLARTLDSIFIGTELGSIDLIKIDVQGAEHLVLKGAVNTLKVAHFVWIELSFKPLYIGSSIFHHIYEIMEANNFVLLEISPGHRSPKNELLQADALFGNLKYL